jgi:hypothetical protein
MRAIQVYLQKTETGEQVEAIMVDEVTNFHLALWKKSWAPAMKAHCEGRTLRNKPEDHHWNWKRKANDWRSLLGHHSFAILCEARLQGLMLANDFKSARLQSQFGKPIVHVEYLATAPWNRPEIKKPPLYRGVGTVMVGAAVDLSFELGYRGRIGLHSLPAAEPFYGRCGMTALGKDAADQGLMYFEMTENQAEAFRQ